MGRKKVAWLLGVTALVMPLAGPAQAQVESRLRPANKGEREFQAAFEGSTINLSGDWGDAKACLVWRQGGVSECFRTEKELDAREAELAPNREARTGTASEAWRLLVRQLPAAL